MNNVFQVRKYNKILDIISTLVDLSDILFLLKYLKKENNEIHNECVRRIIESNTALRHTIVNYLNSINSHLLSNEFPVICDIIFQYYNPYVLSRVNRQQFVSRTLSRRNDRTADYFIDWFSYFLAESHVDWMIYKKELLQQWTECVTHDRTLFKEVIRKTNMLIDLWAIGAPNNKEYLTFFVKHMVNQCFQQFTGQIFDLLKDGLNTIQNVDFIEAFKVVFSKDQLQHKIERLKVINSTDNPLVHLINIDKHGQEQNKLVKALLILTVSFIDIDDEELLFDTFKHPTRQNITYAILFDSSLTSLLIHKQIISRLITQLKIWDEEGIRASELYIWTSFTTQQRSIFDKIWTLIAELSGKHLYQLDIVFNEMNESMKKKREIIEKVMICIGTYCQQTNDQNMYAEFVQKVREDLQQIPIQSVEIPPTLKSIISFAEKLNPFAKTISWQTFLKDKRTGKSRID